MNKQIKKRIRLFNEQQGKCYWCKRDCKSYVPHGTHDSLQATFDHMWYVSHPKRNNDTSGVMACYECNTFRGNLTSPYYSDKKAASRLASSPYLKSAWDSVPPEDRRDWATVGKIAKKKNLKLSHYFNKNFRIGKFIFWFGGGKYK